MYYSDGNSGWGEEYASDLYRNLLDQNPEDTRNQYVVPLLDNNGNVMAKTGTGIQDVLYHEIFIPGWIADPIFPGHVQDLRNVPEPCRSLCPERR